eukprot:scaffold12470_cov119-Isochrysis_galbana.AAC.14
MGRGRGSDRTAKDRECSAESPLKESKRPPPHPHRIHIATSTSLTLTDRPEPEGEECSPQIIHWPWLGTIRLRRGPSRDSAPDIRPRALEVGACHFIPRVHPHHRKSLELGSVEVAAVTRQHHRDRAQHDRLPRAVTVAAVPHRRSDKLGMRQTRIVPPRGRHALPKRGLFWDIGGIAGESVAAQGGECELPRRSRVLHAAAHEQRPPLFGARLDTVRLP